MIWRPDTCECEIEYDNATFAVIKVHNKCDAHSGVKDDALYQIAHIDNQTKNNIHNDFIEEFPEFTEEIPDNDDSSPMIRVSSLEEMESIQISAEPRPRRLKKGVKMFYVFTGKDDKRFLQVKFLGADIASQKKKDWQKKLIEKVKHNRLKVV